MVVLLDLSEESPRDRFDTPYIKSGPLEPKHSISLSEEAERVNPNVNGMTAALGCYPVVAQLTTHLSLNDLYSLALTCRQVRANILPYRSSLKTLTLRCKNDQSHTIAEGKANAHGVPCARDLVCDCQRCGSVICRNCVAKPTAGKQLLQRLRRLCPTCLALPLSKHTTLAEVEAQHNFGSAAFERGYCHCDVAMHLCVPCAQGLHTADQTYCRVWTWRTRYSNLGGLGTGIGEGNEGVKCGRDTTCFAARDIEFEIDIESRPATSYESVPSSFGSMTELSDGEKGPMYGTHEIKGIGGMVMMKALQTVTVGACVEEWDDERERRTDFMGRERRAEARSWCSWCQKVTLSSDELTKFIKQ